ncbi:GtrA family protein [Fructilactobacillus fructivorans]|uniref:Conserved membrane protein, GtcA family n=1 Tax=Fructilactobacillus fructivorans TaxID=1614 RepID=A0A0C1PK43_9LACO|nr:GtrA family protein [Fructilactobacillus fructivorans]KID41097.1 Conserved membrane protein, GtcA family [Fructilactobacillus fructivorans]KRK57432.1 hypothetical protein FC73_GL000977 [Fructilactobacillus fructivorans]KRN12422.1 hypothetical protein IV37_GL001199 [Fructilactobacillus fructivorans]KRN41085.1 hypothetical protein IV51_GL000830 [Fructilactobacillus fructivorans]KRN42929.1 hypothetical protein IV48_GL000957 [Fructilactobacillus fructivorans]
MNDTNDANTTNYLDIVKRLVFDEKIEYLFWGAMTTLVYFVSRFVSMKIFTSDFIPVLIAQVLSIAFAFVVNKYFVFNSGTQSKTIQAQIVNFVAGRLFVLVLDFLMTYVMIDKFPQFFVKILFLDHFNYSAWLFQLPIVHGLIGSPILLNSFICVVGTQVMAIVINYFVSKYFAFK